MNLERPHVTLSLLARLSHDLLRESDTDSELPGTYNDPILDDLASAVAGTPHLAPAVRDALATCLAVIDLPQKLQCLPEALRLLQDLVPLFLTLHHSPSAVRSFVSMLHASARELAHHPARTRFTRRPLHREAPLFRFHLDAWKSTRAAHDFYALWILLLHRGLRAVSWSRGTFATWLDYVESARLFFTCMPCSTLRRPLPSPERNLSSYLQAFDRGYRRSPHATRLRTGTVLPAHQRRIKSILDQRPFQRRPHAGPDSHGPDLEYSQPVHDIPERRYEFGTITISPIVAAVPPAADDPVFSAADDDELLLLDLLQHETGADDAVVRRPPRLQARFRHLYVRHNFDFWWQLEACHLAGWLALYRAAEVLCSGGPGGLGPALYLLLLGFLGAPFDVVARVRVASYDSRERLSSDELYIDPDRWWIFRYFSPVSSIGPHAGAWIPWVTVPLPSFLIPLAARYWRTLTQMSDPPDFFFPDLAASPWPVAEVWRVLSSIAPTEEAVRSPRKLVEAFPRTLGHGHGLDPVAVYLVSGRGHFRARVQAHYTSISSSDLAGRYGRATENLHAHISASLPSGGAWWSTTTTAPRAVPHLARFGSQLGESAGLLAGAVARLTELVFKTSRSDDPSDLIAHHNASTAYVSVLLLALGLRPRNDGWGYAVSLFERDLNYLPVADKQSKKYREDRILPLPPTASEVLRGLARGRPRLAQRLAEAWGTEPSSRLTMALLLLLDPATGMPRGFALRELRSVFVAMEVCELIDVRLNIGRHVLRTYLRRAPLADDLIDLALGHQRAGREALAFHAATRYGTALGILRDALTAYLDDLGFAPLDYLPTE